MTEQAIKKPQINDLQLLFICYPVCPAERQGFEPWEQLPVHRISSAARSTTPASFLNPPQRYDKISYNRHLSGENYQF